MYPTLILFTGRLTIDCSKKLSEVLFDYVYHSKKFNSFQIMFSIIFEFQLHTDSRADSFDRGDAEGNIQLDMTGSRKNSLDLLDSLKQFIRLN